MRHWTSALIVASATTASADVSCSLTSPLSDEPSTLLIRDLTPNDEAVILVSDRTLIFHCPSYTGARGLECYGESKAPINAPMQLNVASEAHEPGAVVVVTTRNQFFGKNEHIGYHRRHASVRVYTIEACESL